MKLNKKFSRVYREILLKRRRSILMTTSAYADVVRLKFNPDNYNYYKIIDTYDLEKHQFDIIKYENKLGIKEIDKTILPNGIREQKIKISKQVYDEAVLLQSKILSLEKSTDE